MHLIINECSLSETIRKMDTFNGVASFSCSKQRLSILTLGEIWCPRQSIGRPRAPQQYQKQSLKVIQLLTLVEKASKLHWNELAVIALKIRTPSIIRLDLKSTISFLAGLVSTG